VPFAPLDATTPADHVLTAEPGHCFWGFFDRDRPPVLTVDPGAVIDVEAVSHHAGDAPDLCMDARLHALWDAIPPDERGPGKHLMTGPIAVRGALPGDVVAVRVHAMRPRVRHGSNLAAHWGLLHRRFGKERVTIYELDEGSGTEFPTIARPRFGFDFRGRPLYDAPGFVSEPGTVDRQPPSRSFAVPVRPHFGIMGVAPQASGRISSVPPGLHGGNVDNWRLGPGAVMRYPVFVAGANLYVGDPHWAQGDGEICGTAIEASLDARIEVWVEPGPIASPILETDTHWFVHGFGDDLDEAMTMAAELSLQFVVDRFALSMDDAYSLLSVAGDLGITQVVDRRLGCHAAIAKAVLA
jgi:acetamidase/formamidase